MTYDDMKKIINLIDSPVEKLEMVMDFGRHMPDVPENAVCTQILGCASFVEICRTGNNFYGRADSELVRGILAIILAMVDGKNPAEIKNIDIQTEFNNLNLNLGAGRLNGVNSMIRFLHNL
ncbi:MAG: SufE family protein [Alphaproteobacteria bacterium]|nr:SufE family protein [Alphaproteobacteria bacterium]